MHTHKAAVAEVNKDYVWATFPRECVVNKTQSRGLVSRTKILDEPSTGIGDCPFPSKLSECNTEPGKGLEGAFNISVHLRGLA